MSDTYHERESRRRFVIYVGDKVHTETRDWHQAQFVQRLLGYDRVPSEIRVLTDNQQA